LLATAVAAQDPARDYPTKPVRVIVPFPPGAINDSIGRTIATQLSTRLGKQFVVDNRSGAGGVIGSELVANAPKDGYTLLVVSLVNAVNPWLYKLPYEPIKSFEPIAGLASAPNVLVVHPELPVKSVGELIALARQKPGQLQYASGGVGSFQHLGGELFKLMTGTDILHVAYKGSTGARNDIIGGHVDMMFDEVPSVAPNVLAGQVRALGVTGKARSKALPDVPTVSEAGVPGYEHTGWFGIMAPAGTPQPIVDRLNAEIRAIVAKPEVQAYWEKQDTQTMAMTPAESAAFLNADIEKWTKVVKAANIKLE
jgi:tripartite-type tricarboxylate transporter receptor subunit TctC